MKTITSPFAITALLLSLCPVYGADWTQFRGPNHDGSTSEKILMTWPSAGLTQLWKVPLVDGFSAITVGGDKAFTLVTREQDGAAQEFCVGLDAHNGKELWAMPIGAVAKYDGGGDSGTPDNKGGDGPRSTPSIDHDKVYTYSSRMELTCFEAATGKKIWSANIIKEHGGRNIHWESAASPLVEGDLVFVAGGGTGEALLAFDKNTGKIVWKGQDDMMTQSTPIAATILGERQVIFFTQAGLVSVVPKTGDVLWRYHHPYKTSTGSSPVVEGDMVYCSAAYGVGSSACKIAKADGKLTATQLWFTPGNAIASHWSTPVCAGGYLYGIFDQSKFGKAPLQCVELATGKLMWAEKGFGPGGCTLVDGHILVLNDAGDLVLVKATPDAYTEVARSHVLTGKCWNSAGVSNGRIFARSTKEGVCIDVSPKHAQR